MNDSDFLDILAKKKKILQSVYTVISVLQEGFIFIFVSFVETDLVSNSDFVSKQLNRNIAKILQFGIK